MSTRRAALLAGLASLSLSAAPALAAGQKLLKVTFSGNQQVATSDLKAALPIQPGQPIDQAGAQSEMSAVESVYKAKNVGANISARTRVYPGNKGMEIAFSIQEQAPQAPVVNHVAPVADQVSVTGNSKITSDKIVAASGIKPGDALTNDKIKAAQAAISALYKKANVGASVATDWTIPQPGHYDVIFKITEKASD